MRCTKINYFFTLIIKAYDVNDEVLLFFFEEILKEVFANMDF